MFTENIFTLIYIRIVTIITVSHIFIYRLLQIKPFSYAAICCTIFVGVHNVRFYSAKLVNGLK